MNGSGQLGDLVPLGDGDERFGSVAVARKSIDQSGRLIHFVANIDEYRLNSIRVKNFVGFLDGSRQLRIAAIVAGEPDLEFLRQPRICRDDQSGAADDDRYCSAVHGSVRFCGWKSIRTMCIDIRRRQIATAGQSYPRSLRTTLLHLQTITVVGIGKKIARQRPVVSCNTFVVNGLGFLERGAGM